MPGSHINSTLLNGAFRSSKKTKSDCVVVFLDVSKAFDSIGHDHLIRALKEVNMPKQLFKLICNLLKNNEININVGKNTSRNIEIKKGVGQGLPSSPTLFNLAINFILKHLSEKEVMNEFGYIIEEGYPPLTAMAFADDIAFVAKNINAACQLCEMILNDFEQIGLEINIKKSMAVSIKNGKQIHLENGLQLLDGKQIRTCKIGEKIKYLGINFEDEIIFDEIAVLSELKNKLEILSTSPLLHADQKINIINQFIWPTIIYQLQTAPLYKITKTTLKEIDTLIRGCVKNISCLPADTPNAMLYSPRKYRGLAIVRASWEVNLQHINIAQKLERINDPLLHLCRNFKEEQISCMERLQIPSENEIPTAKKLRETLRENAFQEWSNLKVRGDGVCLFKECTNNNKIIMNKIGLSSSDWTNLLKMSTNNADVRSNRRNDSSTILCRHCGEYETLSHVLGKCSKGELLRNERHHRVCDALADELKIMSWHTLREDRTQTTSGDSRFTDIVAIDEKKKIGYILDPTIRWEKHLNQADEINTEKQNHYIDTIPNYKERFPTIETWEIIGLFFGARGVIPKFTVNVLEKQFKIRKEKMKEILLIIIKGSLRILHHHLYN